MKKVAKANGKKEYEAYSEAITDYLKKLSRQEKRRTKAC